MPLVPTQKTSDRFIWVMIQIGVVLIPIDMVFRLGVVRMTICEGILSLAILVWGLTKLGEWKRIVRLEMFLPMAGFTAASALSITGAENKIVALRETVQFLWMFSAFFMFLDFVGGRSRMIRLSLLLLLSAAVISLFGLYQYFFVRDPIDLMISATRQRASAFYGQPNALGSYLIAVLPILWSLCISRWQPGDAGMPSAGGRKALFGMLIITSCALVATYSRGSWIGFVIGISILCFILWKLLDRRSFLATITIAGLCAAAILIDSSLQPGISSRSFSNRQRILLLMTAGQMFVDHPIAGVGSGNFPVRLLEYADPELKEMLYWDYDKERRVFYMNPNRELDIELVHNVILQAACEMGVGGLGALLWIFILYFRRGWRTLRHILETGGGTSTLRAGAYAGTIAVMSSALFGWPFSHGVQEVLTLMMAFAVSAETTIEST